MQLPHAAQTISANIILPIQQFQHPQCLDMWDRLLKITTATALFALDVLTCLQDVWFGYQWPPCCFLTAFLSLFAGSPVVTQNVSKSNEQPRAQPGKCLSDIIWILKAQEQARSLLVRLDINFPEGQHRDRFFFFFFFLLLIVKTVRHN